MNKGIITTVVMFFCLVIMTNCNSNSPDKSKEKSDTVHNNNNVLLGKTFSNTRGNDVLNFEKLTRTYHFITSKSVRYKQYNNFRQVFFDETETYRIEDNYVIIVFSDESQSFEIIDNPGIVSLVCIAGSTSFDNQFQLLFRQRLLYPAKRERQNDYPIR